MVLDVSAAPGVPPEPHSRAGTFSCSLRGGSPVQGARVPRGDPVCAGHAAHAGARATDGASEAEVAAARSQRTLLLCISTDMPPINTKNEACAGFCPCARGMVAGHLEKGLRVER